jgi:hypothetical protein
MELQVVEGLAIANLLCLPTELLFPLLRLQICSPGNQNSAPPYPRTFLRHCLIAADCQFNLEAS